MKTMWEPPGPRLGNNANAFKGGYRLWTKAYSGSTHERFVHEEKKTDQFLAIVRTGISEPRAIGERT